ncbi:acyl-CoA thioesterase [Chryseolinea lacunae]|uniref:Acyl-CoA thioesterase n=1 Tax=Chryseolinea lacunae TaxID=2801331 RepID=A0ABS1L033_9BACT|nr:thioesterase family protein [Chryseolinea lacunae]MBL0743931.1 acyl-CoA thioesterase [Chryseolinea lacunae]
MSAQNPFPHTLLVSPADIDDMGHVNNVVYVRWVQDVAAAHWNALASEELKAKYAWVVLRHEVDYKRPAFLHDDVVGYTWVGEFHGARFERFVTLKANGKMVAEAKTMWCLLDAKTLRPTRVTEEITSLL